MTRLCRWTISILDVRREFLHGTHRRYQLATSQHASDARDSRRGMSGYGDMLRFFPRILVELIFLLIHSEGRLCAMALGSDRSRNGRPRRAPQNALSWICS